MTTQKISNLHFKLRKETVIVTSGFVVSVILIAIVHSGILKSNDEITFYHELAEHLAYAALIATIVGLLLDRLFHTTHLGELLSHIPGAVAEGLRQVGGKYNVEYLTERDQIYPHILAELHSHPYFLNTIIDDNFIDAKPSEERLKYYIEKFQLVVNGNLSCKELIAEQARPLMKEILSSLDQEVKTKLFSKDCTTKFQVKEVSVGTLATFMNFCVFLEDPENPTKGKVMIGWFSDEDNTFHRHTCIISDHPDVVRAFTNYFNILYKAGSAHQLSSYIA
jgi:hypothetical protein